MPLTAPDGAVILEALRLAPVMPKGRARANAPTEAARADVDDTGDPTDSPEALPVRMAPADAWRSTSASHTERLKPIGNAVTRIAPAPLPPFHID